MKREHVLPLVALVLGAAGIFYAYVLAPVPVTSHPDVSTQEEQTLRKAGTRTHKETVEPGHIREYLVTLKKEDPDPTGMFRLISSLAVNAAPVPDVQVTLRLLASGKEYTGKSGSGGICEITVPKGRYALQATHVSYAPVKSSYHPERTIVVPGANAVCYWTKAYACGVKIVGNTSPVDVSTIRFSSNPVYRSVQTIRGDETGQLFDRIRKKWGDTCKICFPGQGDPMEREIVIFDREKGPCRFIIPIVPVAEFTCPTTCDLKGAPVTEPMSWIDIQVVDADDRAVDVGNLKIFRDSYYHEFRFSFLKANQKHYIPPGTYTLQPWDLMHAHSGKLKARRETFLSGTGKVVKFTLPWKLYRVELKPSKEALFQVRDGGTEYYSKAVTIKGSYQLWLPKGKNELVFLVSSQGKHHEIRRSIEVSPSKKLQHVSVTLN